MTIMHRLDYSKHLTVSRQVSLKKSIRQLQLIQSASARILTRTRKVDHIALVLRSLHWLPVCQRIDLENTAVGL